MKKILFSMLVAATMVGCSQDDVVEISNGKAIGFDSFVDKSTRATDATSGNISSFDVWGYVNDLNGIAFNDEDVTRTKAEGSTTYGAWGYAHTQYWTTNKYYFHAISPANAISKKDDNTTASFAATSVSNVSFDFASDGETDLLYDYQPVEDATAERTAEVEFTFKHILSKVKFSFTNQMKADNATLTISDVKITDALSEGTATITNENNTRTVTWAKKGTATSQVTFAGITDAIAQNATSATDHMYLIPSTGAYTLTFKVVLTQAGVTIKEKTHTVTIPSMTYAPGNSYNLTAVLNDDNVVENLNPIVFSATVDENGWGTDNPQNVPVTNTGA